MPRQLFDYVDGGAYEEVTMRRNVSDLQDVLLRQVVMRDVSERDPSVEAEREVDRRFVGGARVAHGCS